MKSRIEALQEKFRSGHRSQAIAECEDLRRQNPSDLELTRLCATMHAAVGNLEHSLATWQELRKRAPSDRDALFNLGMCYFELGRHREAASEFKAYCDRYPDDPEGWVVLAQAQFHAGSIKDALDVAQRAVALDSGAVPAWTALGDCQRAAGRLEDAYASFSRACELAPLLPELKSRRGDVGEALGWLDRAARDFKDALTLAPSDDHSMKRATVCLLQLDRADEAIQLCRDLAKANPASVTARLGAEWLVSELVPVWHVPMMNEHERNAAYHDALKAVVTPEKTVFEVGTGSGLLAMMAARLGAKKVYTCEAVRLVAETAAKIVERNGLADRIDVIAKPSQQVELGTDVPDRCDILVHEIFSSELLGEQVLPALEDARARLLKPGGQVLPARASIMIALVGGDELASELHVDHAFGFDLRDFNVIQPKKRPIHREDLPRVLLSADVEAFRFDLVAQSSFPPERKRLELVASQDGVSYGVIQWIRFEFTEHVSFENHPGQRRPVASWQQTVYRFDEPLVLRKNSRVFVNAIHDRTRPWFELADVNSPA